MSEASQHDGKSEGLPLPKHSSEDAPMAMLSDAAKKIGWRLTMAKAAAQLFAGTEQGAVIYGEIRERLDTIEGRSIVSKEMAKAVAKQAINDPDLLERGKARFLGSLLQKQRNLEAVVLAANEQIATLPAPDLELGVHDNAENSHGVDPNPENINEAVKPLGDDWASSFASIAEDATSDDLRQRLARVLAGELASPGTYTRATVRKIADLEKVDLENLRKVLPYVFGDVVIRLQDDNQNPPLNLMLDLAEVGLVTEASGTITKNWPMAGPAGSQGALTGKTWVMQVDYTTGHSMSIGIFQLTRTGIAVVDLLGRLDEREIIRRIAINPKPGWSAVRMGKLAAPDRVHLPWEELFTLQAP